MWAPIWTEHIGQLTCISWPSRSINVGRQMSLEFLYKIIKSCGRQETSKHLVSSEFFPAAFYKWLPFLPASICMWWSNIGWSLLPPTLIFMGILYGVVSVLKLHHQLSCTKFWTKTEYLLSCRANSAFNFMSNFKEVDILLIYPPIILRYM